MLAHDNTVIINRPAELQTVLRVYEKHAKASEAMINEKKTEIFCIGYRGALRTFFQENEKPVINDRMNCR